MDEQQKIFNALNEILNGYYPRTAANFQIVKSAGESTLSHVETLDTRFCVDYKYVGSWACDTSALLTNECDVVVPVQIQGVLEKTSNLEYVKFRPSGCSIDLWKDCMDPEGYMNPECFSEMFYNLVERALPLSGVAVSPGLTGKGTVAATLVDQFAGSYEASIDLVPIIVVNPSAEKYNDFLKDPEYEKLRNMQVKLVAKNDESKGFGWRLSFSCFETDLLKTIVESHATFRKLMIIYKSIHRRCLARQDGGNFLEKIGFTPTFKSYHIKILLLNEYKDYPDPTHWKEEGLVIRFLSILKRLKGCVSEGFLPHYILTSVNLFNHGIPSFLLEHYLVTNTAWFLEGIARTSFLKHI